MKTMSNKFDIIIIGGGNGGFGVSAIAAEAGKSIAFIESLDFGGTCPNRGCTPKKVLVAAAQSMETISNAGVHGIDVGPATLDWTALIDRERDMVSGVPGGMAGLAEKRGTVCRGAAKFTGPNTVDVEGTILEADNIVIATGSKPRNLPIPGADLMITSDEVLSERELPGEIVFIGGGVIAMEFSHVYARAGAKVTILEVAPRLLPRMEADAVDILRSEAERVGVTVRTGVKVNAITQADGRLQVAYEHEGESLIVQADRVVNGAGRVANVDELDLDAGNIAHDGPAIAVDEYLRSTSNPAVWVVGDALTTSPQLSPVATYEGKIVGENIVNGPSATTDYSVLPSSVYTIPAYSSVGLTEEQAQEAVPNLRVSASDMTGWFSAKSYAETAAWSKILIDEDNDRIVGAHIIGHHGEDLINLFVLAMKNGITASALKDTIFAYPTFSSDVKNMF
jgi:glutathione reductase (NADPH)